ncbi:GroES-like protein [Microthyrium microscopicum]|uniref:GroES-like protein n=1 Tax=Microthyrium microscopicum TaxID=703497 RepID=A0A6A6U7B7_9PEZI|nr:GroES-like protein [Microthyrium microscopicum]
MKALRFHGNKDLRLDDIPIPEVKKGYVKVKPAWAGICGTDLHEYLIGPMLIPTTAHKITGEKVPVGIGHEMSGLVEEVGDGVEHYKVGDRVVLEPIIYDGTCGACQAGSFNSCYSNGFIGISGFGGAFSEHIVVEENYLNHLPDNVSMRTGALVEPLAVAMRAIANGNVQASDTVLILGGGPIGLAITLCLRSIGVKNIILSEMAAKRKTLALEMGASHVLDPSKDDVVARTLELCEGAGGVDVAFECAGVQPAVDVAFRTVRARGTIVGVSVWEGPASLDINKLVFRERRYVGTAAPEHKDFEAVLKALKEERLKPDGLVTKTVGIHEIEQEGYKSLIEDKANHAKVLVEVGGG